MSSRIVNKALIAGLILIFILLVGFMLLQAAKVLVNLNLMSVTVDKVVVAGRLHDYVLKQSTGLSF
ncbi:MAG TPA: hypothetical protein GXX19_08175 [Syntrophomonadaceae bacterium]|nr:hypothetical protein [Syntrophomonadaceae bacterium]